MPFLGSGPDRELDASSRFCRLQRLGKALIAVGFLIGARAAALQAVAEVCGRPDESEECGKGE